MSAMSVLMRKRRLRFLSGFFFHQFAEYLESIVLSSDKLLITGGFNFHTDVPTDPNNNTLEIF